MADGSQTRSEIIEALPDAVLWGAVDLVRALAAVNPTDADRILAQAAITRALLIAEPWDSAEIANALEGLDTTDRQFTRTAVTDALVRADYHRIEDLVRALVALDPPLEDLFLARAIVSRAMIDAPSWYIADVVGAVVLLDPSESDRRAARKTITDSLGTAMPWQLERLVTALLQLDPSARDLELARSAAGSLPDAQRLLSLLAKAEES